MFPALKIKEYNHKGCLFNSLQAGLGSETTHSGGEYKQPATAKTIQGPG